MTERGSGNIASHADVLRGSRRGRGQQCVTNPWWEASGNRESILRQTSFLFRFALILFSSLFISHRNTEYSGYSPFLQLKMLSQRVLTGTSETIAARLPAGGDMNRPLTPHWWV